MQWIPALQIANSFQYKFPYLGSMDKILHFQSKVSPDFPSNITTLTLQVTKSVSLGQCDPGEKFPNLFSVLLLFSP